MIKLEKMLEDTNPNTDIAADIILSLMKRAYIAGREDGYDEGVMDLVEVDGYDEAFDNALRTINEVYEEETWNR